MNSTQQYFCLQDNHIYCYCELCPLTVLEDQGIAPPTYFYLAPQNFHFGRTRLLIKNLCLFLPVEHRSYNEIFKLAFFLSIQFFAIFFHAHIFAFLTPKMDFLTPKTWEKSPNNIEIGPNFTYPVSKGLETGSAAAKAPHLIKLHF